MNQKAIERELARIPLSDIRFFESLDSTNDAATDWAMDGASDYSLVIANHQKKGRGRLGRSWITIPGASLVFSLILRLSSQEYQQVENVFSRFSGLGAVSVSQALRIHYQLPAMIKWPNDVLVNDKKISGVLAEVQWMGGHPTVVILGIGINIASKAVPPARDLQFPATCLEGETGASQNRLLVLRHVLVEVCHWRSLLMDEVFLRTWEAHLAYRGEWIRLTSQDGSSTGVVTEGRVMGLDSHGALKLVSQTGGVMVFHSGEIPDGKYSALDDGIYQPGSGIQLRPVDSLPK